MKAGKLLMPPISITWTLRRSRRPWWGCPSSEPSSLAGRMRRLPKSLLRWMINGTRRSRGAKTSPKQRQKRSSSSKLKRLKKWKPNLLKSRRKSNKQRPNLLLKRERIVMMNQRSYLTMRTRKVGKLMKLLGMKSNSRSGWSRWRTSATVYLRELLRKWVLLELWLQDSKLTRPEVTMKTLMIQIIQRLRLPRGRPLLRGSFKPLKRKQPRRRTCLMPVISGTTSLLRRILTSAL